MTSYALTQNIKETHWARDVLIVIGASLLITLFGSISIPLPFSPIPLATQGSFCLLLGLLLGRKRATLAVLLFLCEGAMGLPVFSLGRSGILHLLGPTGGYLLGTLLGTYLAGALMEQATQKTAKAAFWSMAAGNVVIFICGYCQLSFFLGPKSALILGVLPFLIGDFLKLVLASKIYQKLARN